MGEKERAQAEKGRIYNNRALKMNRVILSYFHPTQIHMIRVWFQHYFILKSTLSVSVVVLAVVHFRL